MKYIWQSPQWPRFTYDQDAVRDAISTYHQHNQELSGTYKGLLDSQKQATLLDVLVAEAIHNSLIEGEKLERDDVHTSVKKMLGLDAPDAYIQPKAQGAAALTYDAKSRFSKPLTKELLWYWQSMILPKENNFRSKLTIGAWRTGPIDIVSGPIGDEKVVYEGPPPEQVPKEMNRFLQWYQQTAPGMPSEINAVERAAIAHFWFETIHPFDDGNGRVGRAIADHALSQGLNAPTLFSLSMAIEHNRSEYYKQLSTLSGKPDIDITNWVTYFANEVCNAQQQGVRRINHIVDKARFWDKFAAADLNVRQQKVINKMFDAGPDGFEGGMSAKKYARMTGCSRATATRDLVELTELGCLLQEGGGRSVRYLLSIPSANIDFTQQVKESPIARFMAAQRLELLEGIEQAAASQNEELPLILSNYLLSFDSQDEALIHMEQHLPEMKDTLQQHINHTTPESHQDMSL